MEPSDTTPEDSNAVERRRISFVLAKVGDDYVMEDMRWEEPALVTANIKDEQS